MNRFHRGSRCLLVLAPALVVMTGCNRQEGGTQDSSQGASPQTAVTGLGRAAPDVQHVKDVAANYTFDGDSAPMPATDVIKDHGKNPPIPVGQDPKMTIAAASWIGSGKESDVEQVVALVKADRAYDGLGVLPQRANYLWRSRSDPTAPWEVWMVPEHGHGPVQLVNDGHSYSQGDPKRPRLMFQGFPPPGLGDSTATKTFTSMVLGVCLDDPNLCNGGHCGYTQ